MFKPVLSNLLTKPIYYTVQKRLLTMTTNSNFKLMDIGLNLIDAQFEGHYHGKNQHPNDIKCVINRMLENDVEKCMLTTSCIKEYYHNLELCEKYENIVPNIGFTVGVHPCSSMDMIIEKKCDTNDDEKICELNLTKFEELENIWKNLLENDSKHFMAFGEFGLDYDRLFHATKEVQLKVFEKQLEIVSSLTSNLNKKPPVFFLHMRSCGEELLDLLDKYLFHKDQVFIIHSFTDSLEIMNKIVSRDNFYVSFNNCSLRTEEGLENLKQCPLNKMFLETDAPWCGIRKTHPSYPLLSKALEENKDELNYKQLNYEILKKKKIGAWFETNGLDKDNYLIQDRHEPCELWKVYLLASVIKKCSYKEIVDSIWENCEKVF
ncbi:hypothetical protein ACO0SA_002766 [Hanseniaspora valbyensis]